MRNFPLLTSHLPEGEEAFVTSSKHTEGNPLNIGGVVPSLSVKADLTPVRSESGIGALMPWANKLWLVSYVSHKARSGSGTGLSEALHA